MGLTDIIIDFATRFIDAAGAGGVFVLMIFESMIAPVPSEAVLPFAGFLVSSGRFDFVMITVVATLGSIVGSLISYYLGALGGRPLVIRVGKYFLLDQHHLDWTERWFSKYGQATIFVSRFIPIVRHLISIPAGLGRMPIGKFILYTTLGAGGWNAFLIWVGLVLRDRWDTVSHYTHWGDYIILCGLVVSGLWFVWHQIQRRRTD
jgi:membrane protein DedA with SNARE-associated domain